MFSIAQSQICNRGSWAVRYTFDQWSERKTYFVHMYIALSTAGKLYLRHCYLAFLPFTVQCSFKIRPFMNRCKNRDEGSKSNNSRGPKYDYLLPWQGHRVHMLNFTAKCRLLTRLPQYLSTACRQ